MKRALLGEFVGTFGLVLAGCGAIMADALGGGLGTAGIALAFGLAVAAMGWIVGAASGAHLNPAVSLGLALGGRFPGARVLPYAGAQIAGAIAAAAVLRFAVGNVAQLGATELHHVTIAGGFALEVLATALLVSVVLAISAWPPGRDDLGPLAAGGAVALDALFVGPMTMASMNPARSLGPALVAGSLDLVWLYIAAPLAGAAVAVILSRALPARPAVLPPTDSRRAPLPLVAAVEDGQEPPGVPVRPVQKTRDTT